MAETVVLPVELSGIERAQQRAQEFFQQTAATASQLQKTTREFTDIQTDFLTAEGAAPGTTFRTPVELKDIKTVNEAGEEIFKDVVLQVTSRVEGDLQAWLKSQRRKIQREGKKAKTPEEIQKTIQAQEALQRKVIEGVDEGSVSREFLDQVKDDIARTEQQLETATVNTKKEQAKSDAQKLKEQTARIDKRTKDTLTQIGEFSLKTVDSVRAAQRETEELMLNLSTHAGKPGGVSESLFRQIQGKEQALRKREEALTQSTVDRAANEFQNRVKTHFDNRRRTMKEMFKVAGGDTQKLADVFNQQDLHVRELKGFTDAGILNTNQRLTQARAEFRQTAQTLRQAHMSQMTRSDRLMVMTPEERVAEMDRRREVHSRALTERQNRRRQRNQQVSQSTLGFAGAGIGLFGQAGFPLLNVGFAAMSSPMHGAVAAFTTTIGEASRALMRWKQGVLQSAEALGALSKGLKEIKAEVEAQKAFFGAVTGVSEARKLREDLAFYQQRGVTSSALGGAIDTRIRNPLSGEFGGGGVGGFLGQILRDTAEDLRNTPEALKEARDSMVRHLQKFSARFESGEQMFERISTAAASRGTDERRLIQKQIELFNKQIEANESLESAATHMEKTAGMMENTFKALEFLRDPGGTAIGEGVGQLLRWAF